MTAALEGLEEPVAVDAGASDERRTRNAAAAILIWTKDTSDSAAVFREVGECDRSNVSVHVLDTGQGRVLGAIEGLAVSSYSYSDDGSLRDWLGATVLGFSSKKSGEQGTTSFVEAVRQYLSSLSARLSTIDVVGLTSKVEIDSVYVPLKIQDLAADPRSATTVTLLDLFTAGAYAQRLFLVGTPGAGKSTLLNYTALEIARGALAHNAQRIPILIRARDLVELDYPSLIEYIRALIKGCVQPGGNETSGTITHSEEFGDSRTQVFIDGVDELKRNDRPRLRQLLRVFETEYPDVNIALCSRPNGFDSTLWEGYRAMSILPLEVLSSRQYIQRFAKPNAREGLLALLATSERLRELAQVPFMLALMSSYEGPRFARLPLRRVGLIQACVESLLKRRPLSPSAGLDQSNLGPCLANISERLFRLNPSGGHRELEFLLSIQAFLSDSSTDRAIRALDEIIERTGLLQRDGDQIDFIHRSVWEYFVAVSIGGREPEVLDDIAGAPAWEEPIRLMIGLAPETRVHQLVTRLWSKNEPLALRAAAESPFSLERRLRQLLMRMPTGDAAALVRDLGALLLDRNARATNERLVLDTLQVLLPQAKSCEILWEGLVVLLRVADREEEARSLLMNVFQFDGAESRREQLVSSGVSAAQFVHVSAGQYRMGNDMEGRSVDEGPSHMVRVPQFQIGETPVTNAIRYLFPFEVGSEDDPRSPTDAHPMIGVTWYEAIVLSIWFGCRLPTEAEWEYACRAGGTDDEELFDELVIPQYAWYAGNADNTTHPVRQLRQNSFGLYDMLGNVREWCWDWFGSRYYSECVQEGVVTNPQGPVSGTQKVLRGGCFDWNPANLVPTYRNSNLPNNRGFQNGVRLVAGTPRFLADYLARPSGSSAE